MWALYESYLQGKTGRVPLKTRRLVQTGSESLDQGWRQEATAMPTWDGSLVSCSGAEDRAISCSFKENGRISTWLDQGRKKESPTSPKSQNILILLCYNII